MTDAGARAGLVRRGLRLNYLTIGYNTIEALVSLAAGLVAGSVALVAFGIDSGIEVTASVAAQWRLRSDHSESRERAEQITRRITLWQREAPPAECRWPCHLEFVGGGDAGVGPQETERGAGSRQSRP